MQKQTVSEVDNVPLFLHVKAFLITACHDTGEVVKCPCSDCDKTFSRRNHPKRLIISAIEHLEEQHGL